MPELIASPPQIWLAVAPVDMRRGIDESHSGPFDTGRMGGARRRGLTTLGRSIDLASAAR